MAFPPRCVVYQRNVRSTWLRDCYRRKVDGGEIDGKDGSSGYLFPYGQDSKARPIDVVTEPRMGT
jgi:hypothetical protein